jgi:hypothetical protein
MGFLIVVALAKDGLLLAHRLIGAPWSLKALLVPDEDDGQTNCSQV